MQSVISTKIIIRILPAYFYSQEFLFCASGRSKSYMLLYDKRSVSFSLFLLKTRLVFKTTEANESMDGELGI